MKERKKERKKEKGLMLVESNKGLGIGCNLNKRDFFFCRLCLAYVSLELGSKFGPY